MSKAEEVLNTIDAILVNIDQDWTSQQKKVECVKILQQYAQQVSREAFQAGRRWESWLRTKHRSEEHKQPSFKEWWKSKQEEQ